MMADATSKTKKKVLSIMASYIDKAGKLNIARLMSVKISSGLIEHEQDLKRQA